MIQKPLEILRLAYVIAIPIGSSAESIDLDGELMKKALSQCNDKGEYGDIYEGCSGVLCNPNLNPNSRRIYQAVYTRDGKSNRNRYGEAHGGENIDFEEFYREGFPNVLAREVTFRRVDLRTLLEDK